MTDDELCIIFSGDASVSAPAAILPAPSLLTPRPALSAPRSPPPRALRPTLPTLNDGLQDRNITSSFRATPGRRAVLSGSGGVTATVDATSPGSVVSALPVLPVPSFRAPRSPPYVSRPSPMMDELFASSF